MHLEPLERHHVLQAYPRIRGDAEGFPLEHTVGRAMYLASFGNAYALVDTDELVLAFGGFLSDQTGVGQFWMVGTRDIPRRIKPLTKFLLKQRDPMMDKLGLHRIQSEVLADKPKWVKWAELFGMKAEGVMRQYTHDRKDCVLVAYVREKDNG